MIIEILKFQNRTTNGAIGYNRKKEKELVENHDDLDAVLAYNHKAKSQLLAIENMVDDVEVFRRSLNEINLQGRVKEPLFHVSINFPPGEDVADEMMLQIASDYMADMGYGEQPYAVWRHFDRPHQHIHIISTRIHRRDYKKINNDQERVRSTKLAEIYEKRYGLTPTKHSKGRAVKEETVGQRSHLDEVMERVLKKHPHSMAVFKEMLKEQNILVKEGKNKGIFFVEIDRKGNEGRLFESSKLNAFAKKNVRQRLQINRIIRNKYRTFIKDSVKQLLNHYGADGIDSKQFAAELRKNGIYVEFQSNSSGIFGVMFHYRGFDLKGSDVDKSLSWNVLQATVHPAQPRPALQQKGRKVQKKKKSQVQAGPSGSLRHALGNLFQGSYDDNENEDEDEEMLKRNVPKR